MIITERQYHVLNVPSHKCSPLNKLGNNIHNVLKTILDLVFSKVHKFLFNLSKSKK